MEVRNTFWKEALANQLSIIGKKKKSSLHGYVYEACSNPSLLQGDCFPKQDLLEPYNS